MSKKVGIRMGHWLNMAEATMSCVRWVYGWAWEPQACLLPRCDHAGQDTQLPLSSAGHSGAFCTIQQWTKRLDTPSKPHCYRPAHNAVSMS